MRCRNGHDNIDRAQFCATCGVSLPLGAEHKVLAGEHGFEANIPSETSTATEFGAKGSRMVPKKVAALAIGVVVFLVVAGVFAVGRGASSSGSNQASLSEKLSIDNAATAVGVDVTNLQRHNQILASDLSGFASNLAQQRSDLAATAQEEGVVIAESKNGTDPNQVCSDSDTVQSDADNVGSDGDTVSSTADNVESDITALRSDIATIEQDFTTLTSAQSLLPTYKDGAPSQSVVDQAVGTTQVAVQSALGTANNDIALANRYEIQAYNDAVAAATAGNCAPPATQFTQPTIN